MAVLRKSFGIWRITKEMSAHRAQIHSHRDKKTRRPINALPDGCKTACHQRKCSWTNVQSEGLQSFSLPQLSVLPGVFLFCLARLGSVTGREGSGMACGLQVIEKFVPGGKFILTDHTAQVDFLL